MIAGIVCARGQCNKSKTKVENSHCSRCGGGANQVKRCWHCRVPHLFICEAGIPGCFNWFLKRNHHEVVIRKKSLAPHTHFFRVYPCIDKLARKQDLFGECWQCNDSFHFVSETLHRVQFADFGRPDACRLCRSSIVRCKTTLSTDWTANFTICESFEGRRRLFHRLADCGNCRACRIWNGDAEAILEL